MIKDLHKILDGIINKLFEPDTRRLQQWIDNLNVKNQEAKRSSEHGFLYGGVFYKPSNVEGYCSTNRAIDPSLCDEMERFLKDKALVNKDKAWIRQGLFTLLEPCSSPQDVRDALPECLIPCVPQVNGLDRSNSPAYNISGNPRAMRQYEKILPKMEVYAAGRLIF